MAKGFFIGTDNLEKLPRRIVSLVPSQTELLCHLGLDEEVVGITKFCVHPENWFHTKSRIGGTKDISIEKVKALNPDLIIGNKEENTKEQIDALSEIAPVWVTEVDTFEDALEMINDIGRLTGKKDEAEALVEEIQNNFKTLSPIDKPPKTAAYLIWRKPWMVAAAGTFIDDLMAKIGLANVFSHKSRYPEITLEELNTLHPDLVMLSSEPYPFKAKNIPEVREFVPDANIQLVDGEMFSWYGSRLKHAAAYLGTLRKKI